MMLHWLKAGQKSVNSCIPLATIVNYVHDVAKIKPRKFPAVEIRRKFIGIFPKQPKTVIKVLKIEYC